MAFTCAGDKVKWHCSLLLWRSDKSKKVSEVTWRWSVCVLDVSPVCLPLCLAAGGFLKRCCGGLGLDCRSLPLFLQVSRSLSLSCRNRDRQDNWEQRRKLTQYRLHTYPFNTWLKRQKWQRSYMAKNENNIQVEAMVVTFFSLLKPSTHIPLFVDLSPLTSLSSSSAFSAPLCASRYFDWNNRPSKLCQGIRAALGSGQPLAQLAPSRWLSPRT